MQEVRVRLLQEAVEDYQRFTEHPSEDVEIEIERGRTYLRLGEAYSMLGERPLAENAYRSACSHFASLCQGNPGRFDCRLERANSHTRLGLILAGTKRRHTEAHQAYRTAISELRVLAKIHPNESRLHEALGKSLASQGALFMLTGPRQKVEATLREAIEEFTALESSASPEAEPAEPGQRMALIATRNLLSQVLVDTGRIEEAGAEKQKTISHLNVLVNEVPQDPRYRNARASTRMSLAEILRKTGRYGKELEAYSWAATDYEWLAQALPHIREYKERLAVTRSNCGQLLYQLGNTSDAQDRLGEALNAFTELVTDYTDPRYREEQAACRGILGQVLSDLGENKGAKSALESSLATFRQLVKDSPNVPRYQERLAVTYSHLGQVLHKMGDHAASEEAFRAAAKTLEDLVQAAPGVLRYQDEAAFVYTHLGDLFLKTDNKPEAEKAFRRARELREHLATESPVPASPCFCVHPKMWTGRHHYSRMVSCSVMPSLPKGWPMPSWNFAAYSDGGNGRPVMSCSSVDLPSITRLSEPFLFVLFTLEGFTHEN